VRESASVTRAMEQQCLRRSMDPTRFTQMYVVLLNLLETLPPRILEKVKVEILEKTQSG
jgi:hypothetical protein